MRRSHQRARVEEALAAETRVAAEDESARAAPPPPGSRPAEEEFDVIVVGVGLAGSAVVWGLAEALPEDFRILALEAGQASHHALGGRAPPDYAGADGRRREWSPRLENVTRFDVPGSYGAGIRFEGQSQGIQCKVLGGCGVMNGALTQVP